MNQAGGPDVVTTASRPCRRGGRRSVGGVASTVAPRAGPVRVDVVDRRAGSRYEGAVAGDSRDGITGGDPGGRVQSGAEAMPRSLS